MKTIALGHSFRQPTTDVTHSLRAKGRSSCCPGTRPAPLWRLASDENARTEALEVKAYTVLIIAAIIAGVQFLNLFS